MTGKGGQYAWYWISDKPSILVDPFSLPQDNLYAHEFEQEVLKPTAKTSLKATPLRSNIMKHLLSFLPRPDFVYRALNRKV